MMNLTRLSRIPFMWGQILFALLMCLTITSVRAQGLDSDDPGEEPPPVEMRSLPDSAGYELGWTFGKTIIEQGAQINSGILTAGMADAVTLRPPALPEERLGGLLSEISQQLQGLSESGEVTDDDRKGVYGQPTTNSPDNILTKNDTLSYAIGYQFGYSVLQRSPGINPIALVKGTVDNLEVGTPQFSEDLMPGIRKRWEEALVEREREVNRQKAKESLFLSENASAEGVSVLKSGIQYREESAGTGETPIKSDLVTLHIDVETIEGDTIFSSHSDDKPLKTVVSKTSADWIEILTKMKVGSRWKMWVPAEVAFAKMLMPPGATPRMVVVELELLSIAKE